MPKKKYRVDLSPDERTTLEQLLRSGKTGARKLTRARILLKADDGLRGGDGTPDDGGLCSPNAMAGR